MSSSAQQSKKSFIVSLITNGGSYIGQWFKAVFYRFSLFSRRENRSLVRRFQSLFLIWALVVYGLAVAGFWGVSNHVINNTLSQQSKLWLATIDELSVPVYISQDKRTFSAIEDYIKNIPEVAYVRLYQADGTALLASYQQGELKQIPDTPDLHLFKTYSQQQLIEGAPIRSQITMDTSLTRLISPVTIVSMPADDMLDLSMDSLPQTANVIGYIDIGLDFSVYQQQLREDIASGSIVISIILLLVAIAGRYLTKLALKPLLELREPLDRLARGETDILVEKHGDEEIAAISKALNSTISAIKGRDEELRRLADYDGLTGLLNKRSFEQLLENECDFLSKNNTHSALLFIDLDQFKYVNDTLGHAAGDRLLVSIADLLKKRLREDDVIARLGGDEFMVLARSVDQAGAREVAASILSSLHEFVFIEQGKSFNIYCSIGVYMMDGEATAAESLSTADLACYQAKMAGRNRYHLADNLVLDEQVDIGWSHRITEALSQDKFVLHYQPVVSASENHVGHFEVLLRMLDDDNELLSPALFIPMAERFGLATEIDYWVIKNSIRSLADFNRQGKKLRFYINLSGQVFSDPVFVDRVVAMLVEYGAADDVTADQVVFELTERAAVGNIKSAALKMQGLIDLGFSFAIDDFGSGFSSFTYLKHMPVDCVKIEGEFVERIMHDDIDRAMVKSMTDIAKACGKKVVAEFVCDQETVEVLKGFGVDYMQGFYLAKPGPDPLIAEHDLLSAQASRPVLN